MSIDLSEIKSPNELIMWLEIKDINLRNCRIDYLLTFVWSYVSNVWENIDNTNFTDHTIRHSISIINNFLKFDPIYEWSKYEKLIFSISALIHDIGMQYNVFKGFATKVFSKFGKDLSQDKIRELHAELCYYLIKNEIELHKKKEFPDEIQKRNEILKMASQIAAAHSGKKFLKVLASDNPTWIEKEEFENFYHYRPRLLAGMLRICDDLDANHNRILQYDRIKSWAINDISKLHWFACIFVERVKIEIIEKRIAIISFKIRVPEKSNEHQISLIKELLKKFRECKLLEEISIVDEFYNKCNEMSYKMTYEIVPIAKESPAKFEFTLDDEYTKFMEEKVLQAKKIRIFNQSDIDFINEKNKDIKIKKIRKTRIISTKIKIARYKKRVFTLHESLSRWLDENGELGHFELVNGEHTNTYIYCRTLVSNPDLLSAICEHIYMCHRNHNIDRVLAVGTSAIPIASQLSYRLECSSTFTMLQKINKDYYPSEVYPILNKEENLLIVDDVISGGRVAKQVIDLIENEMKIKMGDIFHHTIFRLGDRAYIRDPRIRDYSYIEEEPNIIYASSPDNCPLCKAGVPIKREIDM